MTLRFHTQTAGCTLTAQQPNNNIVRVAFQALAAVLGGTQSLHTNSRDEALALPTEESVNIALRTQQIIAYETAVAETIDPLAGSYYIEAMTDRLEELAEEYIAKVDQLGGAVAAIEKGYFQQEIMQSAYEYQMSIERNERIVVGVNKFAQTEQEAEKLRLLKVDPAVRDEQCRRIAAYKKRRDNRRCQKALAQLEDCARATENLMPPILEAVRAGATLGEICDTLRKVFGEYDKMVKASAA
jgi:methylmalonyl-CoA mutase N-terminal domain/subunit